MQCISCENERANQTGAMVIPRTHAVRKNFECKECGKRFSTLEVIESEGSAEILEMLQDIKSRYNQLGKLIKTIAEGKKIA